MQKEADKEEGFQLASDIVPKSRRKLHLTLARAIRVSRSDSEQPESRQLF
jgi:hypothetical protein